MADVNANIGVQIDTSDALAQLKSLQRQLSQFHTSVAKSSATAAAAQKSLQKNLIGSINSIGAFSAELRTVKTSAESFTNSLEKNKFSMREYFRYAGASTKTFGRLFTSELDTISKVAEDRVKKLQTQYIKLGRDSQGAMKAIAIMPNQLDFSKTSTQLQIAAQKQAIFNQLLKQGSTNLLNFGKNTQWAGRQLMVGFTIPLGILGMRASQTFMDMEKAALKFKKVYGDLLTSPEETKAALDGITELGKQYTKYGVAVADTVALSAEAAAAGFQGLDLQRQTAQATRLSVLGQIEAQQALETTIALQNAFKMSSEDLAGSIDFLNAVENQTVTSLDDITIAIPKVAPVIQQLGGDVKDLAFFLTAMKEGGINASEGANALKSGLAAIINPTTKAKAMLEGLGINITKIVESNKGDIKSTVVDFAKALDTLDPLTRARAIEQLFGKFQFARLSTLFQNVTKDGTQASRVLDLAGSSIEDLASLANKELGMSAASPMNQFKKAVEDLKLALVPVGEVFLKTVTPILEFFGNLLSKFAGLSDTTKKVITVITVALAGVGPVLLMTFGLLANGVANIIKLFATLRNGYLRLTGQSQMLGEQTQYMTIEQLEAAAAAHSLNQSHATLKQTFDVEKASLDQLIASYQSAARASAAFAASNPGSMLPIPGGRKPKKFAKGKPYMVGGSGNRDSEPAMLAPGETVIPAAMSKKYGGLINGMIAGNIPGYRKGKGGDGDFAHITSRKGTTLGAILQELESLPDDVKKARRGLIDTITDLVDTFGENVKAFKFSGLGFTQKKSLNIGMANGGAVSSSEFLEDFSGRGISKWENSMSYAGVAMDEVADDLKTYDANLERLTKEFAKKNATITSVDFEGIEKEARMLVPAQSKLRKALDKAAGMVTEYRYNLNQSNVAAAGLTPRAVRSTKDPSKMSKKKVVTSKGGRNVRLGGDHVFIDVPGAFDSDTPSAKAKKDAKQYKKTFEDATQDPYMATRDRKSPHPQAIKDGNDDGTAYSKGVQTGVKKASQSSQAAASRQALYGGGPIDATAKSIRRQEQAKARRGAAAPVVSAMPGIGSRLKSVGGKFAGKLGGGRGMGISSGLMMGSQFIPGKAGEVAGQISTLGFAAQAAIQGLKLLPGPLKLVAAGALAVVGTVKLLNAVQEKARLKVEGLGDAASASGKQLSTLGSFFGVSTRKLNREKLKPGEKSAAIGATQKTAVDALRETEDFQKDFKNDIDALKSANIQDATMIFKALAVQLKGRGFASEQIKTIIQALQQEAGKTSIKLDFENIGIANEESLTQQAKVIGLKIGKTLSDSAKRNAKNSTSGFINKEEAASINAAGAAMSAVYDGLIGQFEGGEISLQKFQSGVNALNTSILQMPAPTQAQLMKVLFSKIGPEAVKASEGVKGLNTRLKVYMALSSGIISADDPLLKVLNNPKTNDKALGRAQNILSTRVRNFYKLFETETIESAGKVEDVIETTNKDLAEKFNLAKYIKDSFIESKNQVLAFEKLRDAGVDAATAMDLVGNAELALAVIQGGVTEKMLQQIEWMRKRKEQLADYQKQIEEGSKTEIDREKERLEQLEARFNLEEEMVKSKYADKIEKENENLRNQQYELELVNRKIKEQEEAMAAIVDPKQSRIDDISYQLEGISFQEDEINEKYDRQSKLLSTITKMNQDLYSIQKKRMSLADALSSGDISAAASIIMEMRAEEASVQASSQQEVLDAAREQELSALGRVELEKESKKLQYEILTIQKNQSQENERLARIIEKNIESVTNYISDMEESLADEIESVNNRISKSVGMTKTQIQSAMSMIDLANAAGFKGDSKTLITNILDAAIGKANDLKKILGELPNTGVGTGSGTGTTGGTDGNPVEGDRRYIGSELLIWNGTTWVTAAKYDADKKKADTEARTPAPGGGMSYPSTGPTNDSASTIKFPDTVAIPTGPSKDPTATPEETARERGRVSTQAVTTSIADIIVAANKAAANAPTTSSNFTATGLANKLSNMPILLSSGGMIPKYFASGGFNRGTDTVPAMLTPGEFVVNRRAAAGLGINNLNAMNNGQLPSGSVYNYKVDVTLNGSDMNPNDVANAVLTKIKQLESRNIRRQGI